MHVKNKKMAEQLKKSFTLDSAFLLTKQVGTPYNWMRIKHITSSAMSLNIQINMFYSFINCYENTTARLLNATL